MARQREDAPGFVRSEIRAMSGYVPGEQPQDGRVVKLNTNENPYPPSPRVAAAMHDVDELRLYPDPMAAPLREKAADVYDTSADNVLVGNGSDELLAMILRCCVSAGDRVAFAVPTYSLYAPLVTIAGGTVTTVPYGPEFRLPLDQLAALDGRVTFLCNPNAPSGTAVPLDTISELATRLHGLLVVDEAYVDFASQSALELIREHDNIAVLRSFSKSFSLAGLRVGLLFAAAPFIAELAKVKDSYNLDRLSIAGAVAALDDLAWMRANVDRVRATRTRLSASLTELGYRVLPSECNFVLARKPGERQEATYRALGERGILVRYFDIPELEDALRVTVGTDEEIDLLLAALREIGAQHQQPVGE